MNAIPQARYSKVAIWLHWIIAALIVANLLIGFFHHSIPRDARGWWMGLHFSFGMTVLALSVLRLLWRLIHPAPPANPDHPAWERVLAKTAHWGFYLLMIGMPIVGWLIMSTGRGEPISVFGLFGVPALPVAAHNEPAHELFEELHEFGGWAFVGLIALHIAGAFKHHVADKDSTLGRMIPLRSLLERGA